MSSRVGMVRRGHTFAKGMPEVPSSLADLLSAVIFVPILAPWSRTDDVQVSTGDVHSDRLVAGYIEPQLNGAELTPGETCTILVYA